MSGAWNLKSSSTALVSTGVAKLKFCVVKWRTFRARECFCLATTNIRQKMIGTHSQQLDPTCSLGWHRGASDCGSLLPYDDDSCLATGGCCGVSNKDSRLFCRVINTWWALCDVLSLFAQVGRKVFSRSNIAAMIEKTRFPIPELRNSWHWCCKKTTLRVERRSQVCNERCFASPGNFSQEVTQGLWRLHAKSKFQFHAQ